MKRPTWFSFCLTLLTATIFGAPTPRSVFPYPYAADDLPNGLRLITVPTDFPNLIALYIVVQVGSRQEVEPGKSGYAHFFEHLMFRGSERYSAEQRDALLKRAGAEANAYTTDDRTVYHEVFANEDLPGVLELEADRFLRLKYSLNVFKTEALAVLGEYNKNSADPAQKLYETLRETAFAKHTYSHATMGFLKDIEDMPNQYSYSLDFYRRYYRPEYTTIILAGDVSRDQALALTKKHFGPWPRGDYSATIPIEPAQDAPRQARVDWPSPTLPQLAVAFHGPAFSIKQKDKAALDLLAVFAFGDNSDLYKQLVLQEQKVDQFSAVFENHADPELFAINARVKEEKDVGYVRDRILATCRRYATEMIPKTKLDETRSHLRYGFALSLDTSEAIASALAEYVAMGRSPEVLEKLFALYDSITPQEVQAAAARCLTERNRTIVTLATKSRATKEAP